MATTGKVNGNILLVYMEDEALACTTQASINVTNEQIEVTCKDNNGAKTYILGGQDWSITVGGLIAYDNDTIIPLMDNVLAKVPVTVRFGTAVVGDPYFQGEAVMTNLTMDAPLNGVATWSATFSSNGPLTKALNVAP